jgi:hypothetical protein
MFLRRRSCIPHFQASSCALCPSAHSGRCAAHGRVAWCPCVEPECVNAASSLQQCPIVPSKLQPSHIHRTAFFDDASRCRCRGALRRRCESLRGCAWAQQILQRGIDAASSVRARYACRLSVHTDAKAQPVRATAICLQSCQPQPLSLHPNSS